MGVWKEEFQKGTDPHGRDDYWLTGAFSNDEPDGKETDECEMRNNFGDIVPIHIDVTDYQ